MDKIVSSIVGLGIPGLILLTAIEATGLVGAASITAALSAIGPGGMIGGIATLAVACLISKGIAEYGFNAIFESVIKKYTSKGESIELIIKRLDDYPISNSLKAQTRDMLRSMQSEGKTV